MKNFYCRLTLILALLLPLHAVWAQGVTTSSMTGTVNDDKGEGLPGATVVAVHTPTGTRYGASTSIDGRFQIPNMRVGGPYSVEVTFIGFQTQTFSNITLRLAEPHVLNVKLGQGAVQLNEVSVTAENSRSVLSANRTGSTTNVGTREIERLPTITRSLNDFTRLTPQASGTSVGGGNYRQNNITVDGADFNNNFGIGGNLPANGSPISLDAIAEISVNLTPYDVKQSGFIGSSINAVTRSGTNEFSGSAYTFFRNENQQGNKVGPETFARQPMDINTYGFRLGGPVIKNKLFFFVNAEVGKEIKPGQQNIAATATSGTGSYGSANNINRPLATELDEISNYLRTTYGYETGPYQGYDNESTNNRFVGRLDWNINNNHRFNIRYSQVESKSPSFPSTSRSPFKQYDNTNNQGRQFNSALWFQNAGYFTEANFYSAAAELNSTFGKFANTLRATYTNQNDPRSSDSKVFPFVDILKDGLPFTSFGYEPFSYGNLRDVQTYSVVDYVTWTAGKHNLTVGGQADLQTTKNGFQRFATSYYTFASWADFVSAADPEPANRKLPTDFAMTYSLLPGYEQAFPRFKFAQYAAYAQDEMSITDKFRLTAGLRVDLTSYLDVQEIKTHPLVANLTFAGNRKVDTGVLPDPKVMFSPRLGFNWDIKGDRSLQLRGGSGIFTGKVPTVWIVAQSGDAGLIQITRTESGNKVPGPFNPDPNAYRPATQPAAGTVIPNPTSSIDPNFRFPQTWKSSLAVDAKLPGGIVATLEGIYNKDLNVALGRNLNLVEGQAMNVAGYPDNRPIYPNYNTYKFLNPLISGQAVAQGSRPDMTKALSSSNDAGAFNAIELYNRQDGYYWSVTGKLDKQFSNGLFASVAYVKSKAEVLFDGSGDQLINTWSNTAIVNNSNDPQLSYANYVVPDRLIASLSYRKEYLKNLATTFSVFYEGSSAGRFSYTYGGDFNRDGQNNDLIYIPKDASEITFTDFNFGTTAAPNVFTAKQQSDFFFRYIEQDKYLNAHKGQYAERNGAKMPWRNQVDIKFAQELFHDIAGKRNSLQFTADIFNFGNLLNSDWGLVKSVNSSSILVPTNLSSLMPGGTTSSTAPAPKPTFRLATDRSQPVTTTFRNTLGLTSTYYMQFGFRYTFN